MKACPVCGRLFPDDGRFCPVDGAELSSATQVPVRGSDDDARIGQLMCERYQMRRVVADGGMGRVYEALDMIEKRHVALKILHPDVAEDEVALERFKREFEVSKQLPHRHIVEVLDFQATHDGSYALIMEFLYGEELRSTLKRERVIAPERVVRMVSQAALALDQAHTRKFVHRDLKPDNVFLCQTTDGDITKILDFGSVKDKASNAKKLTVMGTTIGSPYYMAPEQAQGLDTLDHRADVWALAAITYECVAGRVPFRGSNGPSILLQILTKEPAPVSAVAKNERFPVPPTLDRVLVNAFRKQAAVRTATVGVFADAVGAAYGLEGSHREWAETPQAVLAGRIQAKLPELMTAVSAPQAQDPAAESFFGDSAGLGVMGDPFASVNAGSGKTPPVIEQHEGGASRRRPPEPAREPPESAARNSEPLLIPTSNTLPLLIATLVGVGALGVGILAAWFLLK